MVDDELVQGGATQARIRFLYEQIRALELEAVRRPRRRARLVRALLLVVAAAAGAGSVAVAHPSAPRELAHAVAVAPVVHVIDAPAERARLLPAPAHVAVHRRPQRAVVVRRVARRVVHVAPVAVPRSVVHATVAPVTHAAPAPPIATAPAERPAPQPKPVRAQPKPRPPVPSVPDVSVGGAVVVSTSEEPDPEATPTTDATPAPTAP